MSDFQGEDYDFAIGSIKGLRSWSIDDKGRLRGVTHPAIWKPGENVAECKSESKRYCPSFYDWMRKELGRPVGVPAPMTSRPEPCGAEGCNGELHPEATHSFDPNCQCGFWAYDEVGFQEHGDAVGVIEGYGRTTIGTKGFRCEKARVVALCRETEKSTLSLSEWLRLKELYPEAEFFDEFDDMVLAHGQVLRSWPTVTEDFWDEEKPVVEGSTNVTLTAHTGNLSSALAQVQAQIDAQVSRALMRGVVSHPRQSGKRNPLLPGLGSIWGP